MAATAMSCPPISASTLICPRRRSWAGRAATAPTPSSCSIGPEGDDYDLVATLVISVPSLDREQTRELAEAAHQRCPYSRATRGNISVELRVP